MTDEAVEHGDLVREGDRLWHPEHAPGGAFFGTFGRHDEPGVPQLVYIGAIGPSSVWELAVDRCRLKLDF